MEQALESISVKSRAINTTEGGEHILPKQPGKINVVYIPSELYSTLCNDTLVSVGISAAAAAAAVRYFLEKHPAQFFCDARHVPRNMRLGSSRTQDKRNCHVDITASTTTTA